MTPSIAYKTIPVAKPTRWTRAVRSRALIGVALALRYLNPSYVDLPPLRGTSIIGGKSSTLAAAPQPSLNQIAGSAYLWLGASSYQWTGGWRRSAVATITLIECPPRVAVHSARKRSWLFTLLAFLAVVAQSVVAFAPLAEGRDSRMASHVESSGTPTGHFLHNDATCAACQARSIHGTTSHASVVLLAHRVGAERGRQRRRSRRFHGASSTTESARTAPGDLSSSALALHRLRAIFHLQGQHAPFIRIVRARRFRQRGVRPGRHADPANGQRGGIDSRNYRRAGPSARLAAPLATEAIADALAHNAQLEVAREQTAEARARRVTAIAIPDPTFSAAFDQLSSPFALGGAPSRPVGARR